MMEFTCGNLFSGIGGLDLGLQRAGWNIRWQVEINDYCRRVLHKNFSGVRQYGDIKKVNFKQLEKVDLVAGGFPCQPVSGAGKKLAQADPRWLWPQFARAIRALRPRFVVVENVAGLFVRGFGDILGDLAALGYDAEWEEFPASAVGAPHLRYRIFVVAYPKRERPQGRARHRQQERQKLITASGDTLPDSNSHRRGRRKDEHEQIAWSEKETDDRADGAHGPMAHADSGRFERAEGEPEGNRSVFSRSEFDRICARLRRDWPAEPNVGRVAYGVPHRMERCEGLGNAVVPAQAQVVGELLKAFAEHVD